MSTIMELARIIRSKNAGPFMTTIDMFFDKKESYERVKKALTTETIVKRYNITQKDVIGIFYYDIVMGIKVTILKPGGIASGDQECTDTFGASQHVPLIDFTVL